MNLLCLGVVSWTALHLIPAVAPRLRDSVIGRVGYGPYRGLFSLGILASLVLMVMGWRASPFVSLYAPPLVAKSGTFVLMLIALAVMGASIVPTNLRRFVRHPQMTATAIWAIAHLLSNGEARSVVLFGGIGLWAFAEIVFINKRDGEWVKPEALSSGGEFRFIAVVAALLVGFLLAHPYLFGVSPFPTMS